MPTSKLQPAKPQPVPRAYHFYKDLQLSSGGLKLQQILGSSDFTLEYTHDWVQWVLPSNEPSEFNADSPVLSMDECMMFRGDSLVMWRYMEAVGRVWTFFDIRLTPDGLTWADKTEPAWLIGGSNHNWLRVTRLLKSNRLLGLDAHADVFYAFLLKHKHHITPETLNYWKQAALGPLWS